MADDTPYVHDGSKDVTEPFHDSALFARLLDHEDPDVAALAAIVEALALERDRHLAALQALCD